METTFLSRQDYLNRLSTMQMVPNWGNQTGLQFEVKGTVGVNHYSAQYSTLSGVSTDNGLTLQYVVGGLTAETEVSNGGNIKLGSSIETPSGLEFVVSGVAAGPDKGQFAFGLGRQIGPSFLNVSVSALLTSQGSEIGNFDERNFIDEDGNIYHTVFTATGLGWVSTTTIISPGPDGTGILRKYDPMPYNPSLDALKMGGDGGNNTQPMFTVAHCFVAGTPVLMGNGASRSIESIVPGDIVAAFDEQAGSTGALGRGRVARVFRGITDTWIELSNGLVVTPGHHFMASDGRFRTIENILKTDRRVISADGEVLEVEGLYIRYSEATASLFEEGEAYAVAVEGSNALESKFTKGWRTYNFEVDDLHTHVAGGVRVHNTSYFTASGKDIPVGTVMQGADGYTWVMNPDGSMTNNVGHTTPAVAFPTLKYGSVVDAEIKQQRSINPSEQYDMASKGAFAHSQTNGSGPAVRLASGSVVNAGTKFTTGDGYQFEVRGDGSVINLDTGHVTGNGTTHYDPDTNTWVTVGGGKSNSGSSDGTGSSSPGSTANTSSGDKPSQSAPSQSTPKAPAPSTGGNDHPEQNSDNWWHEVTGRPVLVDLDGNGIKITQQSSSNTFLDMAGDGKFHRTAWAGAGDGVLVRDDGNDGVISRKNEIDFSEWDPTAKSDMQALRDIFDTNHNNKLDSGDTDWALFKVMVTNADGTTSLQTLSLAGIASIDLISNNQETDLPDGSKILGTASYTKTGGGTGTVGDAQLSYDANGYVVGQSLL